MVASGRLLIATVASSGPQHVGRVACVVMSEPLHLTIVYEDGEDGWIVASIPEVPGAHSQGRDRAEARENVIDALRGILELRFGEHGTTAAADSEPLELVIGV
jgi:predicted RNase H-like HicB family nuclease